MVPVLAQGLAWLHLLVNIGFLTVAAAALLKLLPFGVDRAQRDGAGLPMLIDEQGRCRLPTHYAAGNSQN